MMHVNNLREGWQRKARSVAKRNEDL